MVAGIPFLSSVAPFADGLGMNGTEFKSCQEIVSTLVFNLKWSMVL